jgi:dynactin complex subunit
LDNTKFVEKKAQLQSNIVQNTLQSAQISAQIDNLNHQKTAESERINFTVAVAGTGSV